MKFQDKVEIERGEILTVDRFLRGHSTDEFLWIGWKTLREGFDPSQLRALRTGDLAEDFCRKFHGQAVPLQGFIEAFKGAWDKFVEDGVIGDAICFSIRGMEWSDPNKAVTGKRLEHIQQQLIALEVDHSPLNRELIENILINDDHFHIPVYLMEDYHPLKLTIDLRKNKTGDYDLERIEIRGMEVMRGMIGKIDLDDLQRRMSQINWTTRYNDPNEYPKMRPVLEDLKKLEKYPIGNEVRTRLYLKYMDSAYIPGYQASPDIRREKLEKRAVIRCEKDKPVKLKEVCALFVGKAARLLPDESLEKVIKKKDVPSKVKVERGRSKGL